MFDKKIRLYNFCSDPHGAHKKIVKYVGRNKRVLDVGCGAGYLAEELKKNGCYIVGIELDNEAAELAKLNCDSVIIADVEQIGELPYSNGFFDLIVYADILEHLRRPDVLLSRFRGYLNPSGFAVASIPNIARLDIRLNLLFGKFEYGESGILDKGHLRFFTLETAKRLFTKSGYEVIGVDYTGIASKTRILPTLFGFQFILLARGSNE